MNLWRISEHEALDGMDCVSSPGRWHSPGHRIIYACDHPASAILEMLAHREPDAVPKACRLLKIGVPEGLSIAKPPELPPTWKEDPDLTRAIGDRWLEDMRHPVLPVPSALVVNASNFLLNPLHPEASRIRMLDVKTLPVDPRLA